MLLMRTLTKFQWPFLVAMSVINKSLPDGMTFHQTTCLSQYTLDPLAINKRKHVVATSCQASPVHQAPEESGTRGRWSGAG